MKAWRKKSASVKHGEHKRIKDKKKLVGTKLQAMGYRKAKNLCRWKTIARWILKHYKRLGYYKIERLLFHEEVG